MLKRGILNLKSIVAANQVRWMSEVCLKQAENFEKMLAWQIHSYGGPEELQLTSVRVPVITRPTDVLVKVEAASVNPIDVAMSSGYGAVTLNCMRKGKNLLDGITNDLELPLTLGRDFAGVVVSKGHDIDDNLEIGDEVWGVVPVQQQGCHADYILVDKSLIRQRPQNLTHVEAASILYTGLTAWSALWITGGLSYKMTLPTKRNANVLVLGGSGGVGTSAIQLLKAWNMRVVATCSTDAVEMVQDLGADIVIDYKSKECDEEIFVEGPYSIILDCANQGPDAVKLKRYPFDTYITLNAPLLRNIDQHGLVCGFLKNAQELVKQNVPIGNNKGCVTWGFFVPSEIGIETLQTFVAKGKIKPVIHEVFKFKDLPQAYEQLAQGHARGKIVIDMK